MELTFDGFADPRAARASFFFDEDRLRGVAMAHGHCSRAARTRARVKWTGDLLMELLHLIYEDQVIAVGLVRSPERPEGECSALRYLTPPSRGFLSR